MKRLAILAIIVCAWFHLAPAHAQFNGCSSFCGTSSSAIADAPGFNNFQNSGSPALACTYSPVTTGTQNVAYTGATPSASGGVPAYTFSETGALPTGLSINTSTGIISGTPSVSGTFTGIQVKVADTVPTTVNCGASFTLVIAPAGLSLAWTGEVTDTVGGTTVTYASVPIGTANANRVVAVGIGADTTGASLGAVSAVTIGGVSATQATGAATNNALLFTDIWSASVPSGTTASVVVTYTQATANSGVEAYRIITTTPTPSAGANNNNVAQSIANTAYTVPSGGGSINIYGFRGGSAGNTVITWTNATPTTNGDDLRDGIGGTSNSNPILSVAHTTATGSVTVSASIAGPGFNNSQTISAAAWGP